MAILKSQGRGHIGIAHRRLMWEIDRMGEVVKLMVPTYVSDGTNGTIENGKYEIWLKAILVTPQGGSQMANVADNGGRIRNGSPYLLLLYSHKIEPQYITEIYTCNNKVYTIVDWENVDNADLYYKITLKYTEKKMVRYNGEKQIESDI